MASTRNILLASALAVPIAISGCGGKDKNKDNVNATPAPATQPSSAPATGGGKKLQVSADPSGQLKLNPTSLSAKAGQITLVMKNPGSAGITHGIAVEGKGIDKDGKPVPAGGTSTVSVDLKPGKYEYYCPVDGHKAAGMVGTLTVQ
jgi:plastocyanin